MRNITSKYYDVCKLLTYIPIPYCGYKGFGFREESRSLLLENEEIDSAKEVLTNVIKYGHIVGVP